MTNKNLPSIHPGEILLEEFLRPMGISQYRFFGMSPQFWLNLQNRYDLEVTEDMLVGRLDKEVHALNSHAA
jgi:plasmid maintenance system antidote protein VapI